MNRMTEVILLYPQSNQETKTEFQHKLTRGEFMGNCTKKPDAVAHITGGVDAPSLSGCVEFYQENGSVLIVARIFGLPTKSETGFFGFHIHQGSACIGADFSGTDVIITQRNRRIQNTLVTYHHCCDATEVPVYM